mmetsp:Transcript_753/g.1296  ORF Transcript_753/g.1296 Transcript_753/m.1296 type:complete len:81 (-) Transcript_753:17-259(-)
MLREKKERNWSFHRGVHTVHKIKHMKDERFSNLSILAWYADELDDILDFTKLANDFVKEGRDEQRVVSLGTFSDKDFCLT